MSWAGGAVLWALRSNVAARLCRDFPRRPPAWATIARRAGAPHRNSGRPISTVEAARIDGATRFQTMILVILPLCTPGFISAGIFAFTLSQNEFLYALIFLTKTEVRTVPVGAIAELIRGDVFYWGQLMAAALLGSIPVAIIYPFFVDYYVSRADGGIGEVTVPRRTLHFFSENPK